jgi:hypothetical protein
MTRPTTEHPGTVVSHAGADRGGSPPPCRPGRLFSLSRVFGFPAVAPAPGLRAGGFSGPLSGGASCSRENHGDVVRLRKVRLWPYRLWARPPSAALHHQPSTPARERIAGKVLRCKLRHSPRAALELSPPLSATAVGACARLGACMWRAAKAAGGLGERQPGRTNAAPVAPAT